MAIQDRCHRPYATSMTIPVFDGGLMAANREAIRLERGITDRDLLLHLADFDRRQSGSAIGARRGRPAAVPDEQDTREPIFGNDDLRNCRTRSRTAHVIPRW